MCESHLFHTSDFQFREFSQLCVYIDARFPQCSCNEQVELAAARLCGKALLGRPRQSCLQSYPVHAVHWRIKTANHFRLIVLRELALVFAKPPVFSGCMKWAQGSGSGEWRLLRSIGVFMCLKLFVIKRGRPHSVTFLFYLTKKQTLWVFCSCG